MPETCPVHPSVALVEDTSYDVPREYCPRCESAEQSGTERQSAAPSGTDPPRFEATLGATTKALATDMERMDIDEYRGEIGNAHT